MQQLYEVVLTKPAETAYLRLHAQAQVHLAAGRGKHPAVTTFNAVENALDSILPISPCDPSRALTGMLAVMYRLSLGAVFINYTVNPGKQAVVVLTISKPKQTRTIRRWLSNAIDTGAVNELLATLGIDHPCAKIQVSSRLLH